MLLQKVEATQGYEHLLATLQTVQPRHQHLSVSVRQSCHLKAHVHLQGLSKSSLELSSHDTQGLEKMCACLQLRIQVVQHFSSQHTLNLFTDEANCICRL